jgi:ABC-type Fe3+ transport system substrate-binding protein
MNVSPCVAHLRLSTWLASSIAGGTRARGLLRRVETALLICALAVWPAAVRAQSADVVAKATQEGKVMLYGELITPTMRAIKEGFEAKYPGITMEFIYLSGSPLMNRIVSELDAGRNLADVIAIDAGRLPQLRDKGYLTPYEAVNQANYDKRWWSSPANLWVHNHLYLGGIMYNTKSVAAADVPKTYEDLLDPKWRGKIALVSPISNELMFAMFAAFVRDMGEQKAYQFFDQLAAQKPLVFGPGGIRVSQGVGTGEFPIGIGFVGHVFSVGREPGYNMAFAQTNPVYALGGPGFAVVKTAPHPNAARLAVDYMLSNAAQETIASMGYRSNDPKVKGIPEITAAKVSVAPLPTGADAEKLRNKLKQLFGG